MERRDVDVDPAAIILDAEFERIVDFRLELELRGVCRLAADRSVDHRADPARSHASRNRRQCRIDRTHENRAGQCRTVEVEAARLVAARIADVGQQLVGRLEAQHRGARQFVLVMLALEVEEATARNPTGRPENSRIDARKGRERGERV